MATENVSLSSQNLNNEPKPEKKKPTRLLSIAKTFIRKERVNVVKRNAVNELAPINILSKGDSKNKTKERSGSNKSKEKVEDNHDVFNYKNTFH